MMIWGLVRGKTLVVYRSVAVMMLIIIIRTVRQAKIHLSKKRPFWTPCTGAYSLKGRLSDIVDKMSVPHDSSSTNFFLLHHGIRLMLCSQMAENVRHSLGPLYV
jgi:hypothetical protein